MRIFNNNNNNNNPGSGGTGGSGKSKSNKDGRALRDGSSGDPQQVPSVIPRG